MDFQKDVIEKSKVKPVLVDFWAPWCGPCQHLGPVLEELDQESGNKWVLVKVNVDENQEISNQYGIRGIPDVRLFHDGESIANFTGAMGKTQIEKWLEEHLPSKAREEYQEILNKIKDGDDYSVHLLDDFVERNPDIKEAKMALAEHIVFKNPKKATELAESLAGEADLLYRKDNVIALARLMNYDGEEDAEIVGKLKSARQHFKQSDFDQGLNDLIEAVMIDKNFHDELPRTASVAMFHFLGEKHDLSMKYRRRFDMALY